MTKKTATKTNQTMPQKTERKTAVDTAQPSEIAEETKLIRPEPLRRKKPVIRYAKGPTEEATREAIAHAHAKHMISPEWGAFRVLDSAYRKNENWENSDVPCVQEEIQSQIEAVQRGDLKRAESMLISQALSLESLFVKLAERAMTSEYMQHCEANMRMALRAQSQCRATLETLSTIKNPPVVFAKQANINHGNQQVNNGIAPAPAEKVITQTNELLGGQHGEQMDTGKTSPTVGTDKAGATVE